jgi:hypothetical protein
MHTRAALAVALAALVALAPASAAVTRAGTAAAPSAANATVAAPAVPKIVIVVGPMESMTSGNKDRGNAIADMFKDGAELDGRANVVKVYSPNATWKKVKAAAQGASILIYMGHGNGWPSPYTSKLWGDRQDGMGLNKKTANGTYNNSTKKYIGEDCIDGKAKPANTQCPDNGAGFRLAPNAIVILNGLCYAPGAGEPGMKDPSRKTAKQRVDNYASGFIRAGARAVLADDYGSARTMVRLVLTTDQPILDAWRALPPYSNYWSTHEPHEIAWTPERNPAFTAIMDPETWTTDYKRAITADVALTTADVVAGAGMTPPGDDATALWSTTGPTTVSPNADGNLDQLHLWHRLSAVATWTAKVRDPDGNVVRSQSGTGEFVRVFWSGLIDGTAAPPGTYRWTLHAEDAHGNPTLDTNGDVTVEGPAPPG